MQPKENKLTMSTPETSTHYRSKPLKKTLWVGLGIIAIVAVIAMIWVVYGMAEKERDFEENVTKRLKLMANSQVQLADALIKTTIDQANRVINSELFKLYASEIHLAESDVSRIVSGILPGEENLDGDTAQLAAQLPMMQSLLMEFTRISGYLGGRVVNRNGTVYIATDSSTTPLRSDQMEIVKLAIQHQEPKFAPLQHTDSGLVMESFLPIFPPESSGLDQTPVAVLLLSKVVQERLNTMLSSGLMEKGERIRMVQKATGAYQEVVPWLPGQLQSIETPLALDTKERIPFKVRKALTGEEQVYSLGRQINETGWWMIVEADYDIAREALRGEQKALTSIAVLLILFFGVTFGAIWAILVNGQERKVAKHFEHLAQEIDKQRQLLDQINNNISDYIVFKDLQGRYQYVNPAFAQAVGREPEEMVGLDNEAVFGYDTARRLEHSDQQVLTSEEPYTFSETLYLQSQPHHLQISKSPLKNKQGTITGIVSVIRDVTELIEVQKRQEQASRKTVEALVRAIELTDPYLAGHSLLMGTLSGEVAKAMNASDLEISTVEIAANLSQIGKLFVDRELLFKAEALTADEKEEMAQHVEHAAKVLKDIDFGLPVFEAVYQMYETLDGQGYPKGLQGDKIVFPARVLAIVNSFCAMVQPRAYREARSIDEILSILETSKETYDQRVVAVLKEVVSSSIGEKILAKHRQS